MNWEKWIVVAFLLFATFIITLVTICVKQDISLVSSSYYKEELVYQQQMERIHNVSKLKQPPVIKVSSKQLKLEFNHLNKIEKGEIKLFRPSNSQLDRNFEVKPSSFSELYFDLSDTSPGMYHAKFQWTMNGAEYYYEEIVFI